MNSLESFLHDAITSHAANEFRKLPQPDAELRLFFHGPPIDLLSRLFATFVEKGGVTIESAGKPTVVIPVLLAIEGFSGGDPAIGASGRCSLDHLIICRNSPGLCPKFIALLTPDIRLNPSLNSAGADFGMSHVGHSSITEWWQDDFIQTVVDAAFARIAELEISQREQARNLIQFAVEAADTANGFDVQREGAWHVLSRLYLIPEDKNAADMIALVCGMPKIAAGGVESREQKRVLIALSEYLQSNGFGSGIEKLKAGEPAEIQEALGQFLIHLRGACDITTAFQDSPPYYYCPDSSGNFSAEAPSWWHLLTLEEWIILLGEEKTPEGALLLSCPNSLIRPPSGGCFLTRTKIDFLITPPSDQVPDLTVSISRQGAGAANNRTHTLELTGATPYNDQDLPDHRLPLRYTFSAHGYKSKTLKVVCLDHWELGVFVFCKYATRLTPPKSSREGALECSATVAGMGRYYVDLYCRSDTSIEEVARRIAPEETDDDVSKAKVFKVDDTLYGFEAQVVEGAEYELLVNFPDGGRKSLRIAFDCGGAEPEGCTSEFERLVLAHRNPKSRIIGAINLDKNLRVSDLQSWILHGETAGRSFRPVVISADYDQNWSRPIWGPNGHPVLSRGRFLHDPRPPEALVKPSGKFVEDRLWLAERLRGPDDGGLVESAALGEWLATDDEFGSRLESYLREYQEWIAADPSVALWTDITAYCGLEADGLTLRQAPEAILLNPLHPLRLTWQALAQKVLFLGLKDTCPAASILDPDGVPDALHLPLFAADGQVKYQPFFAVDSTSDYWSILWNGWRLETLSTLAEKPPFTSDFGLRVSGLASGFSSAQVVRALDDIAEMLSAKPLLRTIISSAAGETTSCNEGIKIWSRKNIGDPEISEENRTNLGRRLLHIIDQREEEALPEDADVSNLTDDTSGSVQWFSENHSQVHADLGIIAQLEISNPRFTKMEVGSPVGWGALLRHRLRRQLKGGDGKFLSESRTSLPSDNVGDALASLLSSTINRIESADGVRLGFEFAPSVSAIHELLDKADYVAVSSSAVDPACFLGGWLLNGYLWDYELPSYSQRSGDTTGYYLLSKIKQRDKDAVQHTVGRLSPSQPFTPEQLQAIILEVSRRGIPTVRGLSSGHHGAAGDLGLLIACRLLQDGFRQESDLGGLLPIASEEDGAKTVALVVPIDPFRGYLDDLQNALDVPTAQRPDLLVVGISITPSACQVHLTPIEVKFRTDVMPAAACLDALSQAAAMSDFLERLRSKGTDPEKMIWRLAYQHLLVSMLSFGFRVYSQQQLVSNMSEEWAVIHSRVIAAILSETADLNIDKTGRLIVIDGSTLSKPTDLDRDKFQESITLSHADALSILKTTSPAVVGAIKESLGLWNLLPRKQNPPEAIGVEEISDPNPEPERTPDTIRGGGEQQGVPPPFSPEETTKHGRGIDFCVGQTIDGFAKQDRFFNPSNTQLNQLNIGVVGDLGTGKTQFLKALILNLARSRAENRDIQPKILIFDYKKDYSSADFVQAVNAKIVRPHQIPLNLFDTRDCTESMTPWFDRFNFFADLLGKIYSGIGPVQRRNLKAAVKAAYEACGAEKPPTIYDVHTQYEDILDGRVDSPLSILDDMVDRELFERNPLATTSFSTFLDGVVVVDLASLGQDDKSKNMLVAVMLNMFYENMLRIQKRPFIGTDPQLRVVDSFLLVDEADNIMQYEFDVLRKLLLQGREFGVGVILASQYLSHFQAGGTDYREPLLSWFIHKVPNIAPSELTSLGIGSQASDLASRITSLQQHCCLYKSHTGTAEIIRGTPFYEFLARQMPPAK